MPRYARRRSYGKRKSSYKKRMPKNKKSLKSVIRSVIHKDTELKTFEQHNYAENVSNTGVHTAIAMISAGTGDSERIGDEITLRYIKGRFSLYGNAIPTTFRVMIWRNNGIYMDRNAVSGTNPYMSDNPLSSGSGAISVALGDLRKLMPDQRRFKIYYDRLFTQLPFIGDGTLGTSTAYVVPTTHQFSIKTGLKYRWSDDTYPGEANTTTLRTCPIVFSIWSDDSAAGYPTFDHYFVSSFIDQ